MILKEVKQLEITRLGDLDDGLTAGISDDSIPFIFELVSKQLYSNPIGSVIREITSNCFDSHIEAGVDDPVMISKTYNEDEGYSIEFKDVGVGLSPERVSSIYMNYFSSTKRATNNQIGGFGIGSKTPLAYTDMFYITTIFEGLKYEYIFHKGETKPKLESLLGYDEIEEEYEVIAVDDEGEEILDENDEPITITKTKINKIPIGEETEEHNGTTIKINIEKTERGWREKEDIDKFLDELKYQLAYFDSVYFVGWAISNDYNIYEGQHFKFRSDIDQRTTDIHLCIGKVRYSIDLDKVDVPNRFRKIPIAVKFDIGELEVTPSREAIRYSTESTKLILERINLVADEILTILEQQNPIIEDLSRYIEIQHETPRITFNAEKKHYLTLWASSNIEKSFRLRCFENLPIKKTPKELFFTWEKIGYSSNGVRNKIHSDSYGSNIDNKDILDNNCIIMTATDRVSIYTDIYINKIYSGRVIYIKKKAIDYEILARQLDIKNRKDISKSKVMLQYIKAVDKMVYDNAESYSNLRPTDEWIEEYKRSIIESTNAHRRKREKKVFVRTPYGTGKEYKVEDFEARTGILVYGFREDKMFLQAIERLVSANVPSISEIKNYYSKVGKKRKVWTKPEAAFLVLQISKSVEKDIIGAEKTIYWKDFLNTKMFKKIYTSEIIQDRINLLGLPAIKLRKKFLASFEEDYDRAVSSVTHYNKSNRTNTYLLTKFITDNHILKSMLSPIENLEKNHTFEVPLLAAFGDYLATENVKEVVEYLKYKKVKLRKEWYLKDKRQLEYEKNLLSILKEFKFPVKNLLTYNLNQTNNGNSEENDNNIEESSNESSNEDNSSEEIYF